jgi:hypothetical protein
MYCSYCAAVLDPNFSACPQCGRAVESPAPPQAIPISVAGRSRPSSVRVAVVLLLIPLLLTPLSIVMIMSRSRAGIGLPGFYLIQTAVLAILWIACIAFIWQRQNWARIGVLLITLWSAANIMYSLMRIGASGAVILPLVAIALRLGALYLLFKPESRAWFYSRA